MAMQVSGLLAPLFYPLARWQTQRENEKLNNLLQRAYTGDTAALNELVMRKPELAGALVKMQELQQGKEGWEKFNNILFPQQNYSQGMPEGSVLTSEQIGVTPTQTGITQAPSFQPTLADIRNAMLLLTGARGGNFSAVVNASCILSSVALFACVWLVDTAAS